jgi:hypothetical protein
MSSLALRLHAFRGQWNYELQPRELKSQFGSAAQEDWRQPLDPR